MVEKKFLKEKEVIYETITTFFSIKKKLYNQQRSEINIEKSFFLITPFGRAMKKNLTQ